MGLSPLHSIEKVILRMLAAIVAALAGIAVAHAAATPPATAQAATPDIEVKGRTIEQRRAFVTSMTDANYGQQLTRWNDPICPETIGLPEAYGRFVIQRIQSVARELDIPLSHGRCSPNILILSVPDPDDLMRRFVHKHPAMGRIWRQGLPPRSQVDALLASRAVRWFHASVETDGLTGSNFNPAGDGGRSSILASRIKATTRESASLAVIVLDPDRIVGATWDELADYVAMIGLSRPKLGVDFRRTPSILALYTDDGLAPDAPPGMTPEDRAFLKALYASDEKMSADRQRANIVSRLPR